MQIFAVITSEKTMQPLDDTCGASVQLPRHRSSCPCSSRPFRCSKAVQATALTVEVRNGAQPAGCPAAERLNYAGYNTVLARLTGRIYQFLIVRFVCHPDLKHAIRFCPCSATFIGFCHCSKQKQHKLCFMLGQIISLALTPMAWLRKFHW